MKLSDITRPVERELGTFDPHFREAMRSNVASQPAKSSSARRPS